MKVPEYVMDILAHRTKYADMVSILDGEFWHWVKNNNLEDVLYQADTTGYYLQGSIAVISEPHNLAMGQIRIIENYKGESEKE
jgi:hypothetical protein